MKPVTTQAAFESPILVPYTRYLGSQKRRRCSNIDKSQNGTIINP